MSSSLESLFHLVPGGKLGRDQYRLDRCLGDGTYGFVWKAERLSDNEIIALKVPKSQGGRDSDLEEGRALKDATKHPNVIQIFDMGRVRPEGVYVIEMEYFNSHTLSFLLDSKDDKFTASFRLLLDIFGQVLDGVCHLHGLGIAHGDLKPQNTLVQGDLVKITDFGSSLQTQDIYTRSRENGGTILYSPPEFAGLTVRESDGNLACSHDVYSLGVMLYQLLTGHLPHDTLAQVVRHTPFPMPRELNSAICPAMERITLRCLEKEPTDRWTSVEELRAAFTNARAEQGRHGDTRLPSDRIRRTQDWSTEVLELMEAERWRDAEGIAFREFEANHDAHAFLFMLRAAYRDRRYFDVLQSLEATPEMLTIESTVLADVETLALETYIRTERVADAEAMVERCLGRQGERPGLLLRKASILGLKAKYQEAKEILLKLNRDFPRRPPVLRRLVTVFEQLRDEESANAFRFAIERAESEDDARASEHE
ncbi:MAG TPA: protein kinase [Planctomycetaceae bacterium]|nr:protein kinase [Planctomycetaceae bacterium]